jgi:hypothetical protein
VSGQRGDGEERQRELLSHTSPGSKTARARTPGGCAIEGLGGAAAAAPLGGPLAGTAGAAQPACPPDKKRRQSSIKEQMVNLALWIAAGVLAAVLLVAATNKLVIPKEKLATFPGGGWVEDFSPGALKAISTLEILGAVGLILPAVLGIAPVLVPLAATGAALLFAGAVITRLRRGEKVTIVVDLVYLGLAVFVAWGRFGPEAFHG